MSLADLKKNSKKNFQQLVDATTKLNEKPQKKEFAKDPRYWTLTTDEAGNGYAVLRFILPPEDEYEEHPVPYVRYWDYFFRGPSGKVYSERCLSSLGLKDPVKDLNSKLWGTEEPAMIEQARSQKRRENYVANVLVVNDPANPENNGKVFLFRFGKKILEEKIKAIMIPDDESEVPVDPFNFWEGANFKLKCKRVGDKNQSFPNYGESAFMNPSPVAKTDGEIQKIWNQSHSLKEFRTPEGFKTYDVLKERLNEVLAEDTGAPRSISEIEAAMEVTKPKSQPKATKAASSDDDVDFDALLKEIDN